MSKSAQALRTVPLGRGKQDKVAAHFDEGYLPLLVADAELLRLWARSDSPSRSWQTLLKLAGPPHIEQAERLRDELLRHGWVSVREHFTRGSWFCQALSWVDLDRSKRLLGLATAGERRASAEQLQAAIRSWHEQAQGEAEPASAYHEAVSDLLRSDTAQTLRQARFQLLQAAHHWMTEGRQGHRRDFALFAKGHSKALSTAEWAWLDEHVGLDLLQIEGFAAMLFLSGTIRLHAETGTLDLSLLPFMALPCDSLARLKAIDTTEADHAYWLIENRVSFERQANCPHHGTLIWVPGRPGHAWQAAMRHLLALAPGPARISCDADPSGVAIATDLGALWAERGLGWQPHLMSAAQLRDSRQVWPLEAHDRRLIAQLLQRPTLHPTLHGLCEFMAETGRKAEQEGWL